MTDAESNHSQPIPDSQVRSTEEWLPIVYEELRAAARAQMNSERTDHTLQTTALVHEAYLRLVGAEQSVPWQSRNHFLAAAAEAMRRILVEHARRKLGKKRGGDKPHVSLNDAEPFAQQSPESVVAVSEALDLLAERDPQAAELVKLHCFVGFSVTESAEILGTSRSMAYAHWAYARAQLGLLLSGTSR